MFPQIRVAIGNPIESVSAMITTRQMALDYESYDKLWEQIHIHHPEDTWRLDPNYYLYRIEDCDLYRFPPIHILFGEYMHTIEPRHYVMMGTSVDPTRGCTVRVSEGGIQVSLGVAFFTGTIVQFDNTNKRVAFCPNSL